MKTITHFLKNLSLVIILLCSSAFLKAQNAWINEIHYDNTGTDADEFIEVVIQNAGNYSLSDFSVVLYNGGDSSSYNTKTLDLFETGSAYGDFSLFYYMYPVNGIQNGAPDGMALVYQGTLISGQFLSYEGVFEAIDGPASGITSTDIGVSESSSTPVGFSLQLGGSGTGYSDFTWQSADTATAGVQNRNQTLVSDAISNPGNFNATATSTSQIDLSWALNSNSDSVLIAFNSSNSFGTPGGVYTENDGISGGGTVLHKGTDLGTSHSALTDQTKYYYKAWSFTSEHVYSEGVVDSATTMKLEPSNYPTDLSVSGTGLTITPTWTDATGSTVPDGYLVKISNQDNFTAPTDGTEVNDDLDVSDGSGTVNVTYGDETVTFYRLTETTVYYIKIYPYSNSGSDINYKTDGTPPSGSDTTETLINGNDFEDNTFGTWDTISLASARNWSILTGGAYNTSYFANINGYYSSGGELSNDWLISPSMNFNAYTNEKIIFFNSYQYSGPDDDLKLKYSTDYTDGDPSLATWTELPFSKPASQLTWISTGFIDLSSVSGTNVHIAFHYANATLTGIRSWNVDEIEITGDGVSNPSNFDAATVSSTEIDLSWNKNVNSDDVMVAWNTTNTFGTPTPGVSYPIGGSIFGGGTVLYKGQAETYNHTGRTPATTYYYKAWSYDSSNNYSAGVSDSASTQFPEPSNHPSDFSASSNGPTQITVSWNDSDADHYLIKGSDNGYGGIAPPIDGVGQDDSLLVKNIDKTVQTCDFTGLTPNTTYYFKVWPYNGIGEASNYKTDGTVPQASATTDELQLNLIISEIAEPFDLAGARFVEITNMGTSTIDFATDPVYLCRQANAGNWASVALSGTLTAGTSYVVANSAATFDTAFSTTADQYNSMVNVNGNDGLFLYYGGNNETGILMDAYGQIDTDGDTTEWKYADTHVVRKRNITNSNSNWTADEWSIVDSVSYNNMTPYIHASTKTWAGSTSTDWNSRGNNWSGTYGWVPDASSIVIIPNVTHYPIITEPSTCHELEIQTGSMLGIQDPGLLIIVGP